MAFERTNLPSWQEQSEAALKIHQSDLRESFSTVYPMAHGHNRYQKDGMGAEARGAILDQRKDEIVAFARDQRIDPNVVFGVAEAAMRLGKLPEMGMYGLSESDAWALSHFIADAILNTAHEDEEQVSEINEAVALGSAMKVVVPYSMAGEFSMMAQSARGVSKVMPHGVKSGGKATLYVFFRNKHDAKSQAGDRVKEMAKSLGGKIMEGKEAKATKISREKVQATVTKHMETGSTPGMARDDTEAELGLRIHDHGQVVAYEDMDCEECIAEAKSLDAQIRAYIDQNHKHDDVDSMALELGYSPSSPEFLGALKRVMGAHVKSDDVKVRQVKESRPVEEEFLANPMSPAASSQPSQFGFASPFPWSDSARSRNFIKPQHEAVEQAKPKFRGIGPGSQGGVFRRVDEGQQLNEGLSPVAHTIAKQMGGLNRLSAMLGLNPSKGYFVSDLKNTALGVPGFDKTTGLAFRWPSKKRTRGNVFMVRYNKGSDDYSLAFVNYNPKSFNAKVVKKVDGVQASQLVELFEKQTGYYLRF